MEMTVYALGYSKASAQIEMLMRQENMLLIDTRWTPRSSWKRWDGTTLKGMYKERYRQAGAFLGNVNRARPGAQIRIANLREGVRGLRLYLQKGYSLILLCGCSDYTSCHLQVIVEALVRLDNDLTIWKGLTHDQLGNASLARAELLGGGGHLRTAPLPLSEYRDLV